MEIMETVIMLKVIATVIIGSGLLLFLMWGSNTISSKKLNGQDYTCIVTIVFLVGAILYNILG